MLLLCEKVDIIYSASVPKKLSWFIRYLSDGHYNILFKFVECPMIFMNTARADSRFAPSQWEPPLQSNVVSHWLGENQ